MLFDVSAQMADTGNDPLLCFDRGTLSYGSTNFGFPRPAQPRAGTGWPTPDGTGRGPSVYW